MGTSPHRFDRGNKGGLTFVEGLMMIRENRNILDPVGWSEFCPSPSLSLSLRSEADEVRFVHSRCILRVVRFLFVDLAQEWCSDEGGPSHRLRWFPLLCRRREGIDHSFETTFLGWILQRESSW